MQTKQGSGSLPRQIALAAGVGFLTALGSFATADEVFLPREINSSTIPASGDLNPYGVTFVPDGFPSGGTIRRVRCLRREVR